MPACSQAGSDGPLPAGSVSAGPKSAGAFTAGPAGGPVPDLEESAEKAQELVWVPLAAGPEPAEPAPCPVRPA